MMYAMLMYVSWLERMMERGGLHRRILVGILIIPFWIFAIISYGIAAMTGGDEPFDDWTP